MLRWTCRGVSGATQVIGSYRRASRPYSTILFFFFSSRRRHTRFDCDWSSDVCSSDLLRARMTSIRSIRMLSILLVALSFIAPLSPSHSQQRQDAEQKIKALIARMTLEEKLGQLQQLDGEANGNFRPEHRDLVLKGLLGSTLNVR